MRLNGDGIDLLSVASSAADGHGFRDHGQSTRYPPGYPAMIASLDHMGLGRPWAIIGLNLLFLCLGFACANHVARSYFHLSASWAVATLLFTSLSFPLIKHFTLPLTDIPFFGASMITLALILSAEKTPGPRFYAFWAAGFSTAVASCLIRPTAIALFPCLAWSLGARLGVGGILRRHKGAAIGSAVTIVILACTTTIILLRTIYVRGALMVFTHQGLGRAVRDIIRFRIEEIGQLTLNAPPSKLGALAPIILVAGIVGIAALVFYARRCRLGTVKVYLASYVFIILIWPYGDARFWVPVLPLIFAELFSLAQPWRFTGWKKRLCIAYALAYALLGVAALAYSTRITFSGREFPYRYGDGHLRATYQQFYSYANVDRSQIDPAALEILQRYGGQPIR